MIQELVFIGIVAMTLIGAVLAVTMKRIFYNILSFIVALFGLACLYIYLNCEFIAVMQIIIYIGAIAVAMIFAIMLSVPPTLPFIPRQSKKITKAALVSLLLFVGLMRCFGKTAWPTAGAIDVDDFSTRHLGELFLAQYPLAFEVISLVLLVAIVGAILISRDTT